MNIRRLTEEDIEESWALELDTPDTYLQWPKEDLLASHKNDTVFGVFENGELIGRVGLIDRGREGIEVDGLVVSSRHRKKGIGKLLLRHALHELAQRNITKTFLFTHPENIGSLILYLRNGFIIKEWIRDKFGPGNHRLRLVNDSVKEENV